MNFNRIKEIGYALSEKSWTGRCFHVSFILNKSKILSIGVNNYLKSHPKLKEFKYSPFSLGIHSELSACLKLGLTDCSNLSIVNIRINRNNKLDNSLFCVGCKNLIKSLNFKEAYFTNRNGEFEEYI